MYKIMSSLPMHTRTELKHSFWPAARNLSVGKSLGGVFECSLAAGCVHASFFAKGRAERTE